jgi:hypothetical protein
LSSGKDWNCERGFRKRDRACVAIQVPTNARLTASGNSWMCNPGFRRRGKTCEADKRG